MILWTFLIWETPRGDLNFSKNGYGDRPGDSAVVTLMGWMVTLILLVGDHPVDGV